MSDTTITIHLCGQVMQPGDQLVLTTDRPMSADEAQQVKAQLLAAMPDLKTLLLSGFTATIVRGNEAAS